MFILLLTVFERAQIHFPSYPIHITLLIYRAASEKSCQVPILLAIQVGLRKCRIRTRKSVGFTGTSSKMQQTRLISDGLGCLPKGGGVI